MKYIAILLLALMAGCTSSKNVNLMWNESNIGSPAEEYIVEKSYDGNTWFYFKTVTSNKVTVEPEETPFYIRVIGVDSIKRFSVPSVSSDAVKKGA